MKRLLVLISAAAFLLPIAVTAEETGQNASVYCPNLTRTLSFGSRGQEVRELQHFLSDYFDLSPEDTLTGYFGRLTRANVQKFQCEKMGMCSGSEASNGYGLVGRMTRAAIQSSCGVQTSTPTPTQTPATTNPSCTLSISPSTLTQGQTARLSWSSTNSLRGTITPGVGAVDTSGSTELSILNTTTFTGTFIGTTGAAICSVTATIINPTTSTDSCTFNDLTVSNGTSVVAYQNQSVALGQTCMQETRSCQNGSLSGSYQYSSCTVQQSTTGTSCTFNGRSVAHGSTVTAYQSSSVAAGSTCVSQSRTCANGVLSGSYTNASCSVQSAAAFPFPITRAYVGPGAWHTYVWANLIVMLPGPPANAQDPNFVQLSAAAKDITVDYGDGTRRAFGTEIGDVVQWVGTHTGEIWIQMAHYYSAGTYTATWYYKGVQIGQTTVVYPM